MVEISSLSPKSNIAFVGSILTLGGTRSLREKERGKAVVFGPNSHQFKSKFQAQHTDHQAQAKLPTRVAIQAKGSTRASTRFVRHATRVPWPWQSKHATCMPRTTRPVECATHVFFISNAPSVDQPVVF